MATQLPRLSSSQYTSPDAYIGIISRPGSVSAQSDIKIPCYVAKGNRLFQYLNYAVRRSFIEAEELIFSVVVPYEAELDFQADGNQDSPIRVYDADGVEINSGKWQFAVGADDVTENKAIQISDDKYDDTQTYYMDYQSTDRDVLDVLPFDALREVKNIGLGQNTDQYDEYSDFYIPVSFGSLVTTWGTPAASTITNSVPEFMVGYEGSSSGGGPAIVDTDDLAYTGKYTRLYQFEIISSASLSAVVIGWKAVADQYGNDAEPDTPVDDSDSSTWPTITVDVDGQGATSVVEGILTLALVDGSAGGLYSNGNTFEVTVSATPLIEPDERHSNPSLFATDSSIQKNTLAHLANNVAGTVVSDTVMELTDITSFTAGTNIRNRKFVLRCTAKTGATVTFYWTRSGVEGDVEGNFDVTIASLPQDITINGLILTFTNVATISVDDVYAFTLYCPKIFVKAKDDRSIKFTVTAVPGTVLAMAYQSNTLEGGFGSKTATYASEDGLFTLPGNLYMHARNIEMFTVGDILRLGDFDSNPGLVINTGTDNPSIDWSLTKKSVDEVRTVYTDVNGSVTNEAGTKYVIADHLPVSSDSITIAGGVTFTLITGTAFIALTSVVATTTVTITYEYAGDEPTPGQLYYITANVLRPASHYNTPVIFYDKPTMEDFLVPSTIHNDALIMSRIAWEEEPFATAVCLVKDADEDGTYTKTDYETAVEGTVDSSLITDKLLIGDSIAQSALPRLLNLNVADNDPFNKRPSSVWVGEVEDTEVGDATTPDTLIYMAKETLKVTGDNPAHGRRILVGSVAATKSIVVEGGTTQVVDLNGSFIVGGLCAKNAALQNQSNTLLHSKLTSFDSITVQSEANNKLLGAAQIIYLELAGKGIYTIGEDTTVDTFNKEFSLINVMNQVDLVNKKVRRRMANSLISLTPPSVGAGVALVQGTLVSILRSLISEGYMASMQDETTKEPRPVNPSTDVKVEVDENDSTLYHFYFVHYTIFPIKRLYGLTSLNTNTFSLV